MGCTQAASNYLAAPSMSPRNPTTMGHWSTAQRFFFKYYWRRSKKSQTSNSWLPSSDLKRIYIYFLTKPSEWGVLFEAEVLPGKLKFWLVDTQQGTLYILCLPKQDPTGARQGLTYVSEDRTKTRVTGLLLYWFGQFCKLFLSCSRVSLY